MTPTTAVTLECAAAGVRVNANMPGCMHTPMAVDAVPLETGDDRAARIATRDVCVPRGGNMGTAWEAA
jgi:NAD(P)-dependent dehydrogenase (short-subunit alcohol dehydrogenase family)